MGAGEAGRGGPVKLSGEWGRVVRSPIPKRDELFLMAGDQFADGHYRVVVGLDVPQSAVTELEQLMESDAGQELGERIEHQQMVSRAVAAISALLGTATGL